MVPRRSVLRLGLASVAGAVLRVPGFIPGPADAAPLISFRRGVCDQRFDDSVMFADELRRTGIAAVAVGPDIAPLWYDHLREQSTRAPDAIAGLTDRATLFCLEELARSTGMRVVCRVDHLVDARGHVEHDAVGPAGLVAAARRLPSGPGFGRQMAVLASRIDITGCCDVAAMKRTGPFSPVGTLALVSWVIA